MARNTREITLALTPQAQENRMINLAVNLAEQQLVDGRASSQVICHFLKLGTEKELLERERLRNENNLLEAKTKSLGSLDQIETLYENAIRAFKTYHGEEEEYD